MSRAAVPRSTGALTRRRKKAGVLQFPMPAEKMFRFGFIFLALAVMMAFIVACRDEPSDTDGPTVATMVPTADSPAAITPSETTASAVETKEIQATAAADTPTPVPPTPTLEPLAAMVNGRPIFLADFEKEVARFNQAQEELGISDGESSSSAQIVLEALIETEIIAQAAERGGIEVTDAVVDAQIEELKESSSSEESFENWLQANQWTEAEFKEALWTEMVTERMVGFVTADVPFTVEQARARYIQVDDAALAQSILEQVINGADFSALAQQHSLDRLTGEDGGDLGFFARGSLLVPEVEEAAFALQPGQVSEVIMASSPDGSAAAYYLVQLIEMDPQREITPSLRSQMLQEKFESWLAEQWNLAQVERYVGENQ